MRLARLRLIWAIAIVAHLRPVSSAQSQALDDHIIVSAGIGAGSWEVVCDGCNNYRGRDVAPTGFLRIGRMIRRNVTAYGQLDVWSNETSSPLASPGAGALGTQPPVGGVVRTRVTIASLNSGAKWSPIRARGFFLNGGLGLGRYQLHSDFTGLGAYSFHSHALAYHVGTGYDTAVATHVAVTPYAELFGLTAVESGDSLGSNAGKVGMNVVQIGLGFTWH